MKPFQEYAANGYYVARGLAPRHLVQRLAEIYGASVKPNSEPMLRQSGRIEPNEFTEHGHVKQPLLDPHNQAGASAEFRDTCLDLACCQEVLDGLRLITLRPDHHLYQTMLFEQSHTPVHQDWVYTDSFPSGCLTAAWIALEDIAPTATRFYVVRGSQGFGVDGPHEWSWGSPQYTKALTEALAGQYKDQIDIPEMKQGDVLFWTSSLIHGSLQGSDLKRSRLSLTAHYIPLGFGFGSRIEPCQQSYPYPLQEGRPIAYLDRRLFEQSPRIVAAQRLRKRMAEIAANRREP